MATDTSKKKHVTTIVLISYAAFVVLFSVASMLIVKHIYDQQFPRFDKSRFSGYLRYGDVTGYDRTIVHFPSGRNSLTGYIYGPANKKGLVVISHGRAGGAESYLAETLYFVDKGWRVFAFDNTGSHESEGKSTVGLAQSVLDLDAALTYVESNATLNSLPIMLYGHSWGGYAVSAILNYSHKIAGVASLAGYNSPMELLSEQGKKMMGFFAYVEYPYEWAYQTVLFGSTAKKTAVNGINKTDAAVMVIHGEKDEAISYSGASIIAHRGQITNPNVVFKSCSTENHNGHDNLSRSDAANEYINIKNQEYQKLHDSYKGKIPEDILAKYYEGVDKFKTSELNLAFMNEISRFFEDHLK
jgi:alpha-beta hydrolase superfamily lysophospholipase